MTRRRTVGMPGRLVDILLVRIEKGIDGGDDMPGLCVIIKRSDWRKRGKMVSYVGERSGEEHSIASVGWMLTTLDRVSL